jgi:hypothetical protein
MSDITKASEQWTGRLPTRSPETERFWDACNRGVFLVQRCRTCGERQYHYRAVCANCWSSELDELEASGNGTIWTYSVVERNRSSDFADKVPYVVALVELEEGVSVFGNVIDCDPHGVRIGQPVKLAWQVAEEGQHIPVFRRAAS